MVKKKKVTKKKKAIKRACSVCGGRGHNRRSHEAGGALSTV